MLAWLNEINVIFCYTEFHAGGLSICFGVRAKIGAEVLYWARAERRYPLPRLMIGLPPAPHLLQLLGAMSQNPAVADELGMCSRGLAVRRTG
jgi:hypothetical protein